MSTIRITRSVLAAVRRAVRERYGRSLHIEYGERVAGHAGRSLVASADWLTVNVLLWGEGEGDLWDTPELAAGDAIDGDPRQSGCAILDLYLYDYERYNGERVAGSLNGNLFLALDPTGRVLALDNDIHPARFAVSVEHGRREFATRCRKASELPTAPLVMVAGWLEDQDDTDLNNWALTLQSFIEAGWTE